MDASTRAALIKRISQHFPEGSVIPETWEEVPLTTRLIIETQDAEAAAVFKGQMNSELEAQVLSGQWSNEPTAFRDLAAEREAQIQASLAQLTIRGQEELEQRLQERLANEQVARQNSLRMVGLG